MRARLITTIRYGYMRHHARVFTDMEDLRKEEPIICETPRGTEFARVLIPPEPAGNSKGEGRVMRRATEDDKVEWNRIEKEVATRSFTLCKNKITQHGLEMKLATVEHLFGGENLTFYFLAEDRVDFRALVRDLAAEFKTRIELRQIGVRDEARLVGDVDICGRELCCNTWLRELEPITMRMAKNQSASLDPNKISGVCGRLMCCLSFEDEQYVEMKKLIPNRGSQVQTRQGKGKVISFGVLSQKITVRLESGQVITIRAETLGEDDVVKKAGPRLASDVPPVGGGIPAEEPSTQSKTPEKQRRKKDKENQE